VRIRHLQGVFSLYLRLPSRRGSSAWRSGSSTSTWSPMRTRTRTRRLYGTQTCRYVLHLLAVHFPHKLEEDICTVVTIACEDTSLMCTNAMAASLRGQTNRARAGCLTGLGAVLADQPRRSAGGLLLPRPLLPARGEARRRLDGRRGTRPSPLCARARARARMCARAHARHVCTHAHVRTHSLTRMCARTHARAYTHAHTHAGKAAGRRACAAAARVGRERALRARVQVGRSTVMAPAGSSVRLPVAHMVCNQVRCAGCALRALGPHCRLGAATQSHADRYGLEAPWSQAGRGSASGWRHIDWTRK
jgi:hypothetical protein